MTAYPKLEKPPTRLHRQENTSQINKIKKLKLLNGNIEGANDIRTICEEYMDVFKLPGDLLTATTAEEHTIPIPSIPKRRAITSKNYRLPEA